MPTPREKQIEKLCSAVPCVRCGNPDSPLGSHDCDAHKRFNVGRIIDEHLGRITVAVDPAMIDSGDPPPITVSSAASLKTPGRVWANAGTSSPPPAPSPGQIVEDLMRAQSAMKSVGVSAAEVRKQFENLALNLASGDSVEITEKRTLS